MVWVKLDDGLADHPKVLGLSDTAFRLYVTALCYSARYLTDGMVPGAFASNAVTNALDLDQSPIRELLDAGLWLSVGNDYEIHDFLAYNPSREDVEHDRKRIAERQQRYRSRSNAESNGHRNAVTNAVPVPVPVPLKKKLSFDPFFEAFWTAYPRKASKAGARSKFERLIEKGTDASVLVAGAERYRDDPNREERIHQAPDDLAEQRLLGRRPAPDEER